MDHRALIHRAVGVSLLAVIGLAGPAASADEEQFEIRRLRGDDPVALFDCGDLSKPVRRVNPGPLERPWAATNDKDKPMHLIAKVDGVEYCVKKILVETNRAVPATKGGTECRRSGDKPPRPGFNRGVGEKC